MAVAGFIKAGIIDQPPVLMAREAALQYALDVEDIVRLLEGVELAPPAEELDAEAQEEVDVGDVVVGDEEWGAGIDISG